MSKPYKPFPKAHTTVQPALLSLYQDSAMFSHILQMRWEGAVEKNNYFK